jgi:hypothetical protein
VGLFTGTPTLNNVTFEFNGWYASPDYSGSPWNFSAPITGNLHLYAKGTVDPTESPIDLSGQSGATILAKALRYIAGQTLGVPTTYTIVLAGGTYTLPGIPSDSSNITNSNAVITLVGKSATDINLSSNGSLFIITAGELILDDNITLRGRASNNSSLVTVYGSGVSLTMKTGATITGNSTTIAGGGVLVAGGGSFAMNGGTISGNTVTGGNGGGVMVAQNSSFTLSSTAIITGNSSISGGGVFVAEGSTFLMSGGEISGNFATSGGGGVEVNDSTFTMSGGTISGNTTGTKGGGVLIIDGGSFTKSGGGIIYGKDTAATDNTATIYAERGHAVFYEVDNDNRYYRDTKLDTGDNISTSTVPSGGGSSNNWTKATWSW